MSLCGFLSVSFGSRLSRAAIARDLMSLRPVRGNQGVRKYLRGRTFIWTHLD